MSSDLHVLHKKSLEEYYDRFIRTNPNYKRLQLQFLWRFLHESEFFSPICNVLKQKANNWIHNKYRIVWNKEAIPLPDAERDRIDLSYLIIEDIATGNHDSTIFYRIGKQYLGTKVATEEDYFDLFIDLFLEPLILFLNHHANETMLILELLKKYKQKTEWFTADKLFEMVKTNTRKAEHLLNSDLYSYLFDNGLNFHIEPKSPDGCIDYIGSQQSSPNKILIEGKIFDAEGRSKSYLLQGFEQIRNYTKMYNEDKGYLVVYNVSKKSIVFNIDKESNGFNFMNIDNRNIYVVVINIFQHSETASTRPKSEIVEIEATDLRN